MPNPMLRQSEEFIQQLMAGEGFGMTPEQRERQMQEIDRQTEQHTTGVMQQMVDRGIMGGTAHGRALADVEGERQYALSGLLGQDAEARRQAQMQGLQAALGLGQHQQQYGLQRDQFDFQQDQWQDQYGLQRDQFGLQQDQFSEQQRQFDMQHDLQQQQFEHQMGMYGDQQRRQRGESIMGGLGTGAAIGATVGGPAGAIIGGGLGTLGGLLFG